MADELPTPASRKELYLAKAAGMDVDELPKPASRIEEYLNAIAEGGGGGGGGYVLPTASADTLGGVKIGENLSIDANGTLSAAGGAAGAFKTLTSADYNWPETGTKNAVALWLLDPGIYYVDNNQSLTTKVKVHSSDNSVYYTDSLFVVYTTPQHDGYVSIFGLGGTTSDSNGRIGYRRFDVWKARGSLSNQESLVTSTDLDAIKGHNLVFESNNYPDSSPDGIAIWKLSNGKYLAPFFNGRKIYLDNVTAGEEYAYAEFEVYKDPVQNNWGYVRFKAVPSTGDGFYEGYIEYNNLSTGAGSMNFYEAS